MSAVVVLVVAANCSSDDAAEEVGAPDGSGSEAPMPMIVDYSPTLSDVPALMFLATRPGVDLLAVTLAGTGESSCEPGVRNTRALLVIAGHAEVPVACGPESPMTGSRDWPIEFREAADVLRGVVLPRVSAGERIDAVDLLARTLTEASEPVTIVTLGPLTNLGHLFDAEPELATDVRSIVTMGGAFDVPGNVFDAGEIDDASPDAEWNLYIDPQSVRVVLGSGAPVTFVPLDATNFVPGDIGLFARLSATAATDSGEAVRQLWAASLDTERSITSEWWYFWDELAAAIAVDPSVATMSQRSVALLDSGVTVESEDGAPALVAGAADPERFEQLFLETFAGGEIPIMELSSGEARYLGTVRAAMRRLDAAVDDAFTGVEERADEVPADELAVQMVGDVFDALGAFDADMSTVDVPDRMRSRHQALVTAAAEALSVQDRYIEAVDAAARPGPAGVDGFFEMIFRATEDAGLAAPFDAFEAACGDLEITAYGLGATEAVCFR
jgi:pyrimidine-specific ribonucleoside hydrolase